MKINKKTIISSIGIAIILALSIFALSACGGAGAASVKHTYFGKVTGVTIPGDGYTMTTNSAASIDLYADGTYAFRQSTSMSMDWGGMDSYSVMFGTYTEELITETEAEYALSSPTRVVIASTAFIMGPVNLPASYVDSEDESTYPEAEEGEDPVTKDSIIAGAIAGGYAKTITVDVASGFMEVEKSEPVAQYTMKS